MDSVTVYYKKDGVTDYVPYSSENLEVVKYTTRKRNIRSDRFVENVLLDKYEMSLSMDIEFRPDDLDFIFENALTSDTKFSNSLTSGISVGKTYSAFDLIKSFDELGNTTTFKNCKVDTLSLSITYGELVTGNVGMVCEGFTHEMSSTLPSPRVVNSPYSANQVGVIEIEGKSSGICVSDITLNINNNYTNVGEIGEDKPLHNIIGAFEVEGRMSVYLSPESYQMYLDSLETGKKFQLRFWITSDQDIDTTYEFYIPNCDFIINTPSKGGLDSDVMMEIKWYGVYSPELNNVLIINKYVGNALIDITTNSLWPE